MTPPGADGAGGAGAGADGGVDLDPDPDPDPDPRPDPDPGRGGGGGGPDWSAGGAPDPVAPGAARAVDLFCGAGGASCGMWAGGVRVVAAVDDDSAALRTHRANLPGRVVCHDLREVDPAAVGVAPGSVAWVHGSPPCQGFSQGGRRDPGDDRNALVWRFAEWVAALRPAVATMETVPGVRQVDPGLLDRLCGDGRPGATQLTLGGDPAGTRHGGRGLGAAGYDARWRVLDAADYGVPQRRERVVIVAVRSDLDAPSRWVPAPPRGGGDHRPVAAAIGDIAPAVGPDTGLTNQHNEGHQFAGRLDLDPARDPATTVRCSTPGMLVDCSPPGVPPSGAGTPRRPPRPPRPPHPDCPPAHAGGGGPPDPPAGTRPPNHHPGAAARADDGPATPRVGAAGGESAPPASVAPAAGGVRAAGGAGRGGPAPPDGTADAASTSTGTGTTESPAPRESREPRESCGAPGDCGGGAAGGVPTGRAAVRRLPPARIDDRAVRRLTVREVARLQSFPDWFVLPETKTDALTHVGNAVPPRLQAHLAVHVRRILAETGADLGGDPARWPPGATGTRLDQPPAPRRPTGRSDTARRRHRGHPAGVTGQSHPSSHPTTHPPPDGHPGTPLRRPADRGCATGTHGVLSPGPTHAAL